ncbi:MAG TPA: transglycosylase domain-containing protein, partial [Clostridia bacterium]|nr:transglycosylase domain-containing protein [Clostridia bacterium]
MDKYKVVKQQVKMKKKEITPIKRKFRSVGKVLLTIFLIGVITGCLVFGGMVFYVINFVKPDNIDLNREKLDYTSIVYGQNSSGQTVEVDRLSSQANRIWVDIDQVPKQLKDAVVSIEDQRFYEHEGVDWKRTIGA